MSMPELVPPLEDQSQGRFLELLINEAEIEVLNKSYIHSKRLNNRGRRRFPELLVQAAEKNDTQWLIKALQQPQFLRNRESRKEEGNVLRFVRMPKNPVESLAHAQMDRLRLRAHCRLMLELGHKKITLAARKQNAPWEMEKRTFDTKMVLDDLRRDACQETLLY